MTYFQFEMTEHQHLLNELRHLVAHWTSDPPSRERLIKLLARIRGTMEVEGASE